MSRLDTVNITRDMKKPIARTALAHLLPLLVQQWLQSGRTIGTANDQHTRRTATAARKQQGKYCNSRCRTAQLIQQENN